MKKQLSLRLNEAEYKELTTKAQQAGMKKEPFLRCLIMGQSTSSNVKIQLIQQLTKAINCAEKEDAKKRLSEIMLTVKSL